MAIYDTWQLLQAPTLEPTFCSFLQLSVGSKYHPPSCQQSNLLKYKVSHGEQSTNETDEDDVSSMSNGACGRARPRAGASGRRT